MSNNLSGSRRNFLKSSVAGAAGIAIVGPMANKAKAAEIPTARVDLGTTPINKDVDNLRVSWITDAAMLKPTPTWGGFDTFNNPDNTKGVVYSVVKSNLDKMACALANKTNIDEAWSTLLKIPASKTWATAKAALKVNAFAGNFPSVPIVAKICEVLIAKGMPAANIRLLDGGASGVYSKYTGAGKQIPAGVTFDTANSGDSMAFTDGAKVRVAAGVGAVDILVNIAVNKGHDRFDEFSGVTMCQKNHFWTMECGHAGAANAFKFLARNNSSDHLLGKIPASYPARQQLCIVDSLWLGDVGSWSGSVSNNNNGNSIVMSTFAGAADYVATMKIRSTKIAANTWNQSIVDRFITEYGYAATAKATVVAPQTGAGAGLVNALNWPSMASNPIENTHLTQHGIVQASVEGNGLRPFYTTMNFGAGESILSASIFNMQGKLVRKLGVQQGSLHVKWDGRTDSGNTAVSGNYILKIKGERSVVAGELVVSR